MMLSIVIPTFNERENVVFLAREIDETLHGSPFEYELIFVDDSRDDTPAILERLSQENSRVRFEHRKNARGLATGEFPWNCDRNDLDNLWTWRQEPVATVQRKSLS